MTARLFVSVMTAAAIATTTAASAAETPADRAAREAHNAEVVMKQYPPRALAAGEQGIVGFKLTLDRDGDPTACVVTHSSGHALLDNETCGLLLLHAHYQPETGISRSSLITREGQILWSLPNAAPTALSLPVKVALSDPMDKQICKKTLRTGSLASYERTCRTRREWVTETDEMKKEWENLQGHKGMTTGDGGPGA
ncbi:MAG: energy transducer TonB [Sphingomicrobium sp.]